jgi:biopolymer transport protein ExbB
MPILLRYVICILFALSISCLTAGAQGRPATDAAALPRTVAATARDGIAVGIHDLSPWSMFLNADLVVKAILVGLAFASLVTWTIFVGKFAELFIVKRRLAGSLRTVSGTSSLNESHDALQADRTVTRTFVATALNEVRLSESCGNDINVKERAASSFAEIMRTEARRIRFGMGVLATIAATSPFVGLFGTVWGIMNAFIGISKTQTTNLAVVAPGIAEALLATAIGLAAAIPAVIIYNHFSRVTKGYLDLVSRTSGAVGRQLSRDLDRRPSTSVQRAAE